MIRIRKRTLLVIGVGLMLLAAAIGCGVANLTGGGLEADPAGGQAGEGGGTDGGTGDNGGDAGGTGTDSGDAVQVSSDGRPNAPSNLGADHVAIWNINVSWADNSDDEDGFLIYRQRLDLLGQLQLAGEAGEDATLFYDTATLCGATYKYIVASYNEIGESPASACWVITLPPCTAEQEVDMQIGAANGYDFLARGPANPGDFYLNFGSDSRLMIMADGEGQNGVMDLGFLGDWPLNRVDLPADGAYIKDGVPVVLGNTYAALSRDGSSVIVFRAEELASAVSLRALVWYDIDLITSEACNSTDHLVFTGGNEPGSPCVSGDGVCDPTCSSPTPEEIGRPARDETGMLREVETLEVVELREAGDGGGGGDGDIMIEIAPIDPAVQECIDLAKAMLSDPPTAAEIVAAQAAFYACLDDHGIPVPGGEPEGPTLILRERDPKPDYPTFTPRDYDCDDNACVPGDGICDPFCRPVPDGYMTLRELPPAEEGGPVRLIAEETGDPKEVDFGPRLVVDRGDPDCLPDRNFIPFCGPEKPSEITDSFTLWVEEDHNGDGDSDYFVYVDANPSSPTYGTVIEWDMLCGRPDRRYICDPEWPDALTDAYELVSSADNNGDGGVDFSIWVNTNPDDPLYGDYIVWNMLCGDDELICTPRKPPVITSDYQPVGSEDTNDDGQDDRFIYVNVNPNSPDYGKKIIWDTLCPERKYWCGPREPSWLTDDYEVAESGATYKVYVNTNPASPDYGDIVYWDFGPNCPGDTPGDTPEDPCGPFGGLGWAGDVCVCEGIIVQVTICQDGTQTDVPTTIPCNPDPQQCAPPDDPGDDPGDDCSCDYVCIRQAVTHVGCAEWGYRDSCTGATCKP